MFYFPSQNVHYLNSTYSRLLILDEYVPQISLELGSRCRSCINFPWPRRRSCINFPWPRRRQATCTEYAGIGCRLKLVTEYRAWFPSKMEDEHSDDT